jgi:uncharacterized protein (DUF1015 family)
VPRVFPFEALRYDPAIAGPLKLVTAPPYDVINDVRRKEFLAASEFSVVHLDLAEGSDDPAHPRSRYARAAQLLADWQLRGALVRSPHPSFWVYEMRWGSQSDETRIRGLICAMELEEWGGTVIPHEQTMPGPVEDRLQLLRAIRTHLSAVYGTIQGPCEPLTRLLDRASAADAALLVVDEQGVEHRIWEAPVEEPVAERLSDESLLIADGHHRYTTALHYRNQRHAAQGPGPWDRLLTFIVDSGAEPLPVLPFHRLQMEGSVPAIGDRVGSLDEVLRALSDEGVVIGLATRNDDGVEYRVARLDGEAPAVRALHLEVLDHWAPAGSLRYIPDAREADDAVRGGDAVAAWFLPPTTPDRIRKVAERGERLPQKSTYFWPKPRTGMIMMPLDPVDHPTL